MAGHLAGQLARQLEAPTGLTGRLLGQAMDLANRVPTRLAIDLLAPQDGERILDVGCGTGAALAAVLRRADCRCDGVDASATMIAAARERLLAQATLHCCRIEEIDPKLGPFDAALALNVLYFAKGDGSTVRALHDLLRPGGRLVAYVTDAEAMARWSFVRAGRHRLFDEHALAGLLRHGGFAPTDITTEVRQVAPGVRGLLAIARRA